MLAQDGYLVASVDNRGTGGRGAKFMKMTYLHLGRYESADQIVAARWFGQQPFVSADRIGIWGWSYGGYMTSRTVFLGAGVFKAAIAVAPVTDWRFYDTIYTERYMRTPQENPTGYDESAALTYTDSQGQLPTGAWHGRRQRALPEQRPPGGASRGREQAVRHADLSEQDPLDRRWHHAGKPVRAVHGVAEGSPVGSDFARLGRRALAVLTLINPFTYLDRWSVARLAESMKHSELRLSDTQLGSLMTGFIIVYMIAAPLFGSLGDARSRTRLLGLGVAIWSVATALAGLATSYVSLFAARAAVGVGEAAYGTISPALLADYCPRGRRGRGFAGTL